MIEFRRRKMKNYKINRIGFNSKDAEDWRLGEGRELKKWIGFGFYKTNFIINNGSVTAIYDHKEVEQFDKVLNEMLDEELFDRMCEEYFKIIYNYDGNMVKVWPILTIFDELSKFPEYGNDYMIRRLKRIRESTESFFYKNPKPKGL